MNRRAPKLRLAGITRGPKAPVTVAEYDVTPGLHERIEGEIRRREEAAAPLVGLGTCPDYGHCQPECSHEVGVNASAGILRWCVSHRKILAAHPYTTRVVTGYGEHTAGFGCETCHDWDGVPEGRGNCATILALAEGYGLEPAGDGDAEVVRD